MIFTVLSTVLSYELETWNTKARDFHCAIRRYQLWIGKIKYGSQRFSLCCPPLSARLGNVIYESKRFSLCCLPLSAMNLKRETRKQEMFTVLSTVISYKLETWNTKARHFHYAVHVISYELESWNTKARDFQFADHRFQLRIGDLKTHVPLQNTDYPSRCCESVSQYMPLV